MRPSPCAVTLGAPLSFRGSARPLSVSPALDDYSRRMATVTEATIVCPECGHAERETMPTDACRYFYVCPGCSAMLEPRPGDCCVFCSYSEHACPPKQAA